MSWSQEDLERRTLRGGAQVTNKRPLGSWAGMVQADEGNAEWAYDPAADYQRARPGRADQRREC
jgi:hypothetical protein